MIRAYPINNDDRSQFTRLLIFKIIVFELVSHSVINRKCRDDPSHRERTEGLQVTLTIQLVDYIASTRANHRLRTPRCSWIERKVAVNPKKSWSFNLRLNLKISNFRVRLYGANQRPNRWWLSFQPNL